MPHKGEIIKPKIDDRVDLSGSPWKMHEFFAGSGLVAYGLKGIFSPIWANDNCPQKANIYRSNFIGNHFILDDIKNISGTSLPYAHLSWASFPCQDLSLAGSMGGIHAKRSGLVWEWLRILKEMKNRPLILVVENVVGLLSTNKGENYKKLHSALVNLGYKCGAIVVNASHFVPQSRERVFVIAVAKEIRLPVELVGSEPNWLHNNAAVELGTILSDWIWWKTPKPSKRKISLKQVLELNFPYNKDNVLRLIPKHHQAILNKKKTVIATGYRRMRAGTQQLELRFDNLAGCLRTPEGGSSKQFLVVKQNGETHARLLTIREAARLMGAPDSYKLPNSYNEGYKAMGDAVALPVAKFVGNAFLKKIVKIAYMDNDIERLAEFQRNHRVETKGPLALMVQLTRIIQEKTFPLNPDDFLTKNKGQIANLSGGRLKKILAEYGINQKLASEAGRTSRGNIGLMVEYVKFLNEWSNEATFNLDNIEKFWIDQVRAFFQNKPFILKANSSKTIGANLDELFEQARERQKQNQGTQYLGTVLQHLVAAKLSVIMPNEEIEFHGASVADASTERDGDFVINNTVIHCTTAPGQALIQKCQLNINSDLHPVIITIFDRVHTVRDLAADAVLDGQIEVWDIQQFLSSNVYEHSLFDDTKRNTTLADIIERYNAIVAQNETDPSLRIEFRSKS